jgi:hypothetical protein
VQKPDRVTIKAVDAKNEKLVGFATWNLPKEKVPEKRAVGFPDLPGVNMELWT